MNLFPLHKKHFKRINLDPIIAVVIPAYNVEKSICVVLKKIPAKVNYIIVVDDCSPDGLINEVTSYNDQRVHLISNTHNRGVGGAVLIGYSYALSLGADIVIKIDGDDQMDLTYLDDLLAPILEKRADYSKGNRFLHQQELLRMPGIRKFGNLCLSFFSKIATGYWQIFDPTNGFTAITKQALLQIDPDKVEKNYFFETAMLAELRKADAVIEDVPIPAIYNDFGSSIKIGREIIIFLPKLIHRIFARIHYQYFKFNFTAISFFLSSSIVLGLFGVIWGIVKWIKSSQTGIPATTGTVLIAVLPIILAVQFFVQAVTLDISNIPIHPISGNKNLYRTHDKPMTRYLTNQISSGEVIIRKKEK